MRNSINSAVGFGWRGMAFLALASVLALAGCAELEQLAPTQAPALGVDGEQATVTRVIDGDTIDVRLNGQTERVRYIGINSPEREEACYSAATSAALAAVAAL